MTIEKIDIADLDCIFLTYDEPKKEEFWIKLSNMIPWAKRVDGIKGSDAAHKKAAEISDTDRFILIDGDNIPDPTFFNLQLELAEHNKDCVFRWKARNIVNELSYGNGGISCWTKDFVFNMQTHENSDGRDETKVEFCFDPKYVAMHDCYSTTYPNATAKQAWRAGFREGVKLCLNRGVRLTPLDFEKQVYGKNYDNLSIWHTIGRDVENGWWAIYGARLGTYLVMLEDWDHTLVQDFSYLDSLWNSFGRHDESACVNLGKTLKSRLGLPLVEFNEEQSKFFKFHYKKNKVNLGPSITEVEGRSILSGNSK